MSYNSGILDKNQGIFLNTNPQKQNRGCGNVIWLWDFLWTLLLKRFYDLPSRWGECGLTFSPVRGVPVIRLLVFVTCVLSSLAFWRLTKFRPSRVDLFTSWSLSPNEEPGHPEEPHSDPHLQAPRPEAPTAALLQPSSPPGTHPLLPSRFNMESALGWK